MPTYRVVFTHARHRTRFEVVVTARDGRLARATADTLVRRKFRLLRAGPDIPWQHLSTQEVDLETQAPPPAEESS